MLFGIEAAEPFLSTTTAVGRRPLELIHGAEMNDLGAFTTYDEAR